MEAIITSQAYGKWILVPSEPMLPFSARSRGSYKAIAPSGELTYENRTMPQVDLHFFHIRMKTSDILRFNLLSSPYTLLFNLLGSCIVEVRSGPSRVFHERSCNLICRENSEFSLRFKEKMTSLFLVICFSKEFIGRVEEEIVIPGNDRIAYLNAKNFIVTKDLLDLLSQILFHDCSLKYKDFIIEEFALAILLCLMGKREKGPFQPLSHDHTDTDSLREMKNQLLEVKNRALSFQCLMKTAGIIQVNRLRRLLKSFYGLSIEEFLTEARMSEAQSLLLKMDRPIKQIAAETGYKNVYYFTRIFSAYTGMPPATFQKLNNE